MARRHLAHSHGFVTPIKIDLGFCNPKDRGQRPEEGPGEEMDKRHRHTQNAESGQIRQRAEGCS